MTRDEKKSGDWRAAIRATCHVPLVTGLLIAGAILFPAAIAGEAQQAIAGHANGFTSLEYYAPPNQTRVKSRMSGAEAQPLTGGLLAIKQLKLETFSTNGVPQVVVEAPECIYDMVNQTANSAGHLQLRSGDGKLRVEGDGFLWRQDDSSLTISNHVHMVIETGPEIEAGL